ncbi:MAG TPA: hypothetical protein VEY30_03945, partial [Myxococcaceae bacterium]|nr:hypothetical protein [Myxococcaceae bacterium]
MAAAASVYLNGVNIDGVASQRFEKATVRIDEKGDVFIEAPGYAARVLPNDKATGALTRRYWLVAEQTAPGMTEFHVDVHLNGKWIKKLRNGDGATA